MSKHEQLNDDKLSVSDLVPKTSKVESSAPLMSKKEAEIRASFHSTPDTENTKDSDPTM